MNQDVLYYSIAYTQQDAQTKRVKYNMSDFAIQTV